MTYFWKTKTKVCDQKFTLVLKQQVKRLAVIPVYCPPYRTRRPLSSFTCCRFHNTKLSICLAPVGITHKNLLSFLMEQACSTSKLSLYWSTQTHTDSAIIEDCSSWGDVWDERVALTTRKFVPRDLLLLAEAVKVLRGLLQETLSNTDFAVLIFVVLGEVKPRAEWGEDEHGLTVVVVLFINLVGIEPEVSLGLRQQAFRTTGKRRREQCLYVTLHLAELVQKNCELGEERRLKGKRASVRPFCQRVHKWCLTHFVNYSGLIGYNFLSSPFFSIVLSPIS